MGIILGVNVHNRSYLGDSKVSGFSHHWCGLDINVDSTE